jgi:hypothetical protein
VLQWFETFREKASIPALKICQRVEHAR